MHGHSHSHHDEEGDTDTVSIIDWLNDSVLDSVMGCTMLVTNMTIFIVIKMRKTIEKEYCLLATLVCFNSLFGAMFIYQAYYNTMFAETAHIVHDRWSCIKHPHIVLLPATGCIISLILPCIAFDRYLAVTHPIYYYRLDKNCAKLLALIVTLLFIIITSTLCTVGLIFGPAHVHCHPLDFFSNAANASFMSCGWIGHLVSVLLYFAVIRHLKHQHSCSVVLRECQKCSDHGFVSIRRMFAVFATITLILVVIPVAVMAGHELLVCFRWTHDHLSPEELHAHSHNSHTYFRLVLKISTVNPTINVVFYALRHKQVYIGVREMFSRKVSKTSAVPTRGLLQKLGTKISGQSV